MVVALGGEEDKEGKFSSPGTFIQWESEISSPQLPPDPPPAPIASFPMVAIKDHRDHIFPPINHENLHILTQDPSNSKEVETPFPINFSASSFSLSSAASSSSSSSLPSDQENDDSYSTFSPSGSDPVSDPEFPICVNPVTKPPPDAGASWFNLGAEVLYSKVNGTVKFIRGLSLSLLSHRFPATLAAVVFGFLYFRWRRRLRLREENRDRFARIIREKDERISELLNQIARMNEVLLGFQRLSASKSG